ncbi:MAG: hypothetical protein ACI8ZB_001363 [Desulforhopalus sp.]|jgi:hypothetical protein
MIVRDPNKPLTTPFTDAKPVILVVTRHGHLTETVMEYSLSVAGRLNHRLLVAYINTLPFLNDGGLRRKNFSIAVNESTLVLNNLSQKRGVIVSSIKEAGKVGKVVSRLCRIVKKIEFIIVDKGVKMEEVVLCAPVPVFNVGADTM